MLMCVQVPTFIPVVMIVVSLYLVVIPIALNPHIEFLYAILFVLSGMVFYIPFISYRLRLTFLGTLLLLLFISCLYLHLHWFMLTLLFSVLIYLLIFMVNLFYEYISIQLEMIMSQSVFCSAILIDFSNSMGTFPLLMYAQIQWSILHH